MDRSRASRARVLAGVAVAVAAPAATTLVATRVDLGPYGPPSLYLLGVVVAAAVSGAWGGIAAALLSFLGLNYFFTEPHHTLRVDKGEDVVALLVFLVVAVVVGTLLARALAERERAERQEAEVRMINLLATRLLAADLSAPTVLEFTATIAERLHLSSCAVEVDGDPLVSGGTGRPAGGGPSLDVPIAAMGATLGTLRLERPPGAEPFTVADRALAQALAGLVGLAIERRRLDAEARSARSGAEVSETRAALFSSITHDLRTPLASIKAGITSLMDEASAFAPTERRELFDTVLEETDRLNRLVDNLLNLARARAGDITTERELTPIEDVLETVLSRLRHALEPFRLRTLVRGELPGLWIDPIQMDQALTNVIENAVRYSPSGGEIQIAASRLDAGVSISVADQGPGIAPDERELVFEPFYRGAAGAGRPGSGLGLAIARAVVQAHGGRIRLADTPGGGATVLIDLPRGAPTDPKAGVTADAGEPGVPP